MNQQNRTVVYPQRSSPLSVVFIIGFAFVFGLPAIFGVLGMVAWFIAQLGAAFGMGGAAQ